MKFIRKAKPKKISNEMIDWLDSYIVGLYLTGSKNLKLKNEKEKNALTLIEEKHTRISTQNFVSSIIYFSISIENSSNSYIMECSYIIFRDLIEKLNEKDFDCEITKKYSNRMKCKIRFNSDKGLKKLLNEMYSYINSY